MQVNEIKVNFCRPDIQEDAPVENRLGFIDLTSDDDIDSPSLNSKRVHAVYPNYKTKDLSRAEENLKTGDGHFNKSHYKKAATCYETVLNAAVKYDLGKDSLTKALRNLFQCQMEIWKTAKASKLKKLEIALETLKKIDSLDRKDLSFKFAIDVTMMASKIIDADTSLSFNYLKHVLDVYFDEKLDDDCAFYALKLMFECAEKANSQAMVDDVKVFLARVNDPIMGRLAKENISTRDLLEKAASEFDKSHYEEASDIYKTLLKASAKDVFTAGLANWECKPNPNKFKEVWETLQEYLVEDHPLAYKGELLHGFMNKADGALNNSGPRDYFDYGKIMLQVLTKYPEAFLEVEDSIDKVLSMITANMSDELVSEFNELLKDPSIPDELRNHYLKEDDVTELFEIDDAESSVEEKRGVVEEMAVEVNNLGGNILFVGPVPFEGDHEEPDVPFLKRRETVDIGVIEKRRKLYF